MSKHSIKSTKFLVFLGVAMMLIACGNSIMQRSYPVSEAAASQLENHSVATPNTAQPSSAKSSINQPPTNQRSQTLSQNKSAAKTSAETKQTSREDYKPISLSELGKGEILVGNDPKAIALQTFRNNEPEAGSTQTTVDYPQSDHAVVIITQIGVADDSVGGIRYRAEFVTNTASASTGKQWKLVWAGSQVICQPGRGHQDWSTQLCL